jgi:NitT/TauT family transport system permease protein
VQTTPGSRRVAVLDSAKVRVLGSIGIGLAAIGLWELAAAMEAIDTFTTSRPSAIFTFLASVLPTPGWWYNTWVTLSETLIGLSIGVIAGGLSGALLGMAPRVSRMLDPYITLLNSLPRVALAPLLVLWFGIDK